MKKATTIPLFLIVGILTTGLLFGGCKKRGCIDPNAVNYDFDADKDDGSCMYERTFWCSEDTTGWIDVWLGEFDTLGAKMLYVGRITTFHTSGTPSCKASGTAYAERESGIYEIETENDQGVVWVGSVKFREEDCRMFKLSYLY